jgi:hypothetical protein
VVPPSILMIATGFGEILVANSRENNGLIFE